MTRTAMPAFVELLKPITWFAPMWAFGCGIVSSGLPLSQRWPMVLIGIVVAGPLVCGTSQAVNDWFDRHVDAINEPGRPIPSGRVPGRTGFYLALIWTALSIIVALSLGNWGFAATVLGLALAWAYSAPPLRLKRNGWLSCGVVALSYEGLPWITAAAIMSAGAPDWHLITLAALYSIGAHGIMTLNDFKAVEGDRQMGIDSLPVLLGIDKAARVACAMMATPQIVVIGLLLYWGSPYHAAIVVGLLGAQLALMVSLLENPAEKAPWYNATGTSLYVLGMLASAFAVRPLLALAS